MFFFTLVSTFALYLLSLRSYSKFERVSCVWLWLSVEKSFCLVCITR